MREIKFRGLTDNGKWVYGYYFKDIMFHYIRSAISNPKMQTVDAETVGQYTGLKDKTGKEIYEGDIFKTSLDVVAVVEWEKEGRFLGYTNNRRIIYVNREPQVEVIGNIYGNKELLEVENE